jgi:hypothetical protein
MRLLIMTQREDRHQHALMQGSLHTGVPPTPDHLSPGMELDSGSSNAMEMEPADAEWLIRNSQELNGESTKSDFLLNYRLCPDVERH